MASISELEQVNRRLIASLVGSVPHARELGFYKGKRAIHGSRPRVRCAMYMAALVAVRWDPHWKAFIERHGRPQRTVIDGNQTDREASISCDVISQLQEKRNIHTKPICYPAKRVPEYPY